MFSADNWRHNCVFGNDGANYEEGIDDPTGTNGNLSVDPMLGWSRGKAEYHLQPGSPCVDAGTAAGLTLGDFDIDGEARVSGSTVDIGADELGNEPQTFVPRILRVAVSGNDANDGSTWLSAKRTIQAALDDAMDDGAEVWVAEGDYVGTVHLRPLVKLFGGFGGDEMAREERDPELHATKLDGGGLTNVVRAEYLDQVTELNGFTIQNGRAVNGAGIRLFQSPINIVRNQILQNRTLQSHGMWDAGAGIYLEQSDAHVEQNRLAGNQGSRGAAIFVQGGSPLILRNLVVNNVATNTTTFDQCAGIYLAPGLDPGTRIANNNFVGNLVVAGFLGPSSGTGSAILAGRPAAIVNNTFVANMAMDFSGYPLAAAQSTYTAAIRLSADGSLIANNLFVGNWRALFSDGHSAQSISNNCFYLQVTSHVAGLPEPAVEAGNLYIDPKLVGRFAPLHLANNSPCRDAGNNAFVEPSWVDQDGDDRIYGGIVDIGANEFAGTVPVGTARIIHVRESGDDAADGLSWIGAKKTIQAGIDAAASAGGADVWIGGGSYRGLIQLKPFTYLSGGFLGNESTAEGRDWLSNPTVLDAQHLGTAVTVPVTGTFSSVTGFTIINGNGFLAGGIYCGPGSSPLLANNRIFNCVSGNKPGSISSQIEARYSGGAGIRGEQASPVIVNNLIVSNTAVSYSSFGRLRGGGSAISLGLGSGSLIAHNTLVRNLAYPGIGAIALGTNNSVIRNNVLAFNSSGISTSQNTFPSIETNLFFGNEANGLTGVSPVLANPKFVDDQATFFLATDSPCRDAAVSLPGQPDWTDVYGRARVVGGMADLGAVEMQPDDTTVPITPLPDYTIEVVGGMAYLRYQREAVGSESGALLPVPVLDGTNIFWPFEVSRNLAVGGSSQSFSGTVLLGALPPGSYQFNSVSWGVPLAVTTFTVPADGAGTISLPLASAAGFEFTLNGVDHVRYVTEHSVDWEPWEAVATNDTANGSVFIPAARLTGRDYFRVRLEPGEVQTP